MLWALRKVTMVSLSGASNWHVIFLRERNQMHAADGLDSFVVLQFRNERLQSLARPNFLQIVHAG